MDFIFAGGAREVGGSCIYLRVNNKGILLDAGIRQSKSKDPLPDFRMIQDVGGVDYILISHAHMDHTGSLPVISKAYPAAPVYMTPVTMDLTRILLADSLKIMSRAEEEIPHYSSDDVNAMMNRIIPVPYQTPYSFMDGFSFTFYPAGHIAGAACINLITPEGTIFYSGDVSTFSQQTIEGARIPRLRPDVGLFESTYGNKLHANRQVEEQKLIDTIRECIQENNKILIPSFALGRAQEVLLILQRAMKKNEIPRIPVYVDGMVRDITISYLNHPTDLKATVARKIFRGENPFYSENVQPVDRNEDREALLKKSGPAIFVASSGMLTGGPSMLYAKHLIPDENACIIITGYQDEEAPGRLLLNMMNEDREKSVTLDGTLLPVKCRVEQVGLSAHSDQSELLALISKMSCRRVILVHGEEEAMSGLGNELSKDYRVHVYEPQTGAKLHFEINKKRMQIDQSFHETMHGSDFSDPYEQKLFYQFWNVHYRTHSFTIEECYMLYTGKPLHAEKISENEKNAIKEFAETMDQSVYFSRDARRMFLFRLNTEEEIQEKQKKSEPHSQDVEAVIREMLKEMPVRKISYFQDEKKARIVVNFPDAFSAGLLNEIQTRVQKETGWTVELGASVNHAAMNALLRTLFPGRIVRISYYEEMKKYIAVINGQNENDSKLKEQFHSTTGWTLELQYEANVNPSAMEETGFVATGKPLEQNAAIALIRQMFATSLIQPYRYSLKNDVNGRYLELFFISPMAAEPYKDLIQQCSEKTNWRIRIANSVNQNEAQAILSSLCTEYNIHYEKAASYKPRIYTMELKTEKEIPDEMKNRFHQLTGLSLKRKG